MDYGIKVSEDGFDVKTADEKNLSLKSGFSLLNVYDEGSVIVDDTPKTITHELGYEPQFLVWVDESSGIKEDGTGLATGVDSFSTAFISDSQLDVFSLPGNSFKYYIFYEPISTGSNPPFTPTNDYGIKISKDGYDVKTANILEQTFNSEKNSIKIALTDERSSTVNTDFNFLIAHGLNTVPGYLIYFEVDNNGRWFSENETDTLSGKNVTLNSWTTNVFLVASASSSTSCTVKIKYYILADPAI